MTRYFELALGACPPLLFLDYWERSCTVEIAPGGSVVRDLCVVWALSLAIICGGCYAGYGTGSVFSVISVSIWNSATGSALCC